MRSPGQERRVEPPPERVMETARWWAESRPGTGNLEQWHPVPRVVPQTEEAKAILVETRLEAEAEYAKAEASGDPVGTTVWGRANEHARKLALIYAVSQDHESPEIGGEAVAGPLPGGLPEGRRRLPVRRWPQRQRVPEGLVPGREGR